jgi:putative ABC transport system substrate-binding protein
MRRRQAVCLIGGFLLGWPVAARAQQRGKVWRIGFLAGGARPAVVQTSFYAGFAEGMRQLGYVEGKDILIEWRFAEGNYDRFPNLIADLIAWNVDVIVLGSAAAIRPAQAATSTIPIVMGYSTDPVGNGFVKSLARPGGNVTGLASLIDEVAPKQLQLLLEVIPSLVRVGLFINPLNSTSAPVLQSALPSAQQAGLEIVPCEIRDRQELESAFAKLAARRVQALVVSSDAVFNSQRGYIAERALSDHLPTIFAQGEYVEAGGLMSYGDSLRDFYRRAAGYVDRIIRGAKAGDLPVEQPSGFHLAINTKTARALGIEIPASVLLRADELIEH